MAEEVWREVLVAMQAEGKSYAITWLDHMRPLGIAEDALVLTVPDRFFRDWVRDHYELLVFDVMSRLELGTSRWQILSPDEGGPAYEPPGEADASRPIGLPDFIGHTQRRRVEWGMGEDTWPEDDELATFWGEVKGAKAEARICPAWDAYAKCKDPTAKFVAGGHPMTVFIRPSIWKKRIGKRAIASVAAER